MCVKRWDGSAWINAGFVKRWNGSAWVDASSIKKYDGSTWVETLPLRKFIVSPINPIVVNSHTISSDAKKYNYNIFEPAGYVDPAPEFVGHVMLVLTKDFGNLRNFSLSFIDTQDIWTSFGGYAVQLNNSRYVHRLVTEGYGTCSDVQQAYCYDDLTASQRSFTFTTNFQVTSIAIDIHCCSNTSNFGSINDIIINGETYTITF